ncbi:MAG: ABC transporter permease [Theionarchaea archaeon]|nr:ABC transporter permease [Theionarchaea archaeon]
MSFMALFKFELKKFFKQKPALTGIIIVILSTIFFCILNIVNRPVGTYSGIDMVMDSLHIQNNILFIFPMVTILLTVYSLTGEISTRTLTTVLTKPVKRENIISCKFLSIFLYTCLIFYTMLVISLLFGLRWGYGEGSASFFFRILFIYFIYVLGTLVLVAFTFIVTSVVNNLFIVALISLGFHRLWLIIETFSQIRNYTFSYHVTSSFQLLMAQSINFGLIRESLVVILVYMLAFLLIAATLWERKDIQT